MDTVARFPGPPGEDTTQTARGESGFRFLRVSVPVRWTVALAGFLSQVSRTGTLSSSKKGRLLALLQRNSSV